MKRKLTREEVAAKWLARAANRAARALRSDWRWIPCHWQGEANSMLRELDAAKPKRRKQ